MSKGGLRQPLTIATLSGVLVATCLSCTGYVLDNRPKITPGTTTSTVLCHVTRDECEGEFYDSELAIKCSSYASVPFDAHACYDGRGQVFPAVGEAACFTKYCTPLAKYNGNCRITSVEAAPQFPAQACARLGGPDPTTTPDSVSCEIRGRECVSSIDPFSGLSVCNPLRPQTEPFFGRCFNPVTTSAFDACEGADQLLLENQQILLTQVIPNGCVVTPPSPLLNDGRYSLPGAPVAQASGGGDNE